MLKLVRISRSPAKVFSPESWKKTDPPELSAKRNYVSDEIIAELHRADDRFVESNIRNHKEPVSEELREQMQEWNEDHPGEEGFSGYILSLDYVPENGLDDDNNWDHSKAQCEAAIAAIQGEDPALERLHEIISLFPENWREIYHTVIIEGKTMSQLAREKKVSEGAVRKIVNKMKRCIREDAELKKYFARSTDLKKNAALDLGDQ